MEKRKSAAAAALTVLAAAGIATNTAVEQPLDLLADTPLTPEEDAETAVQEKTRSGPAARLREWILSWHPAVRMLVALPLWCVGRVIMTAASTFFAGAATPLAARLLGWLCLALILLAVYTVSAKAAYPKVSLRRLLRPGTVGLLLGVTALLAAADLALPAVWEGYDAISQAVWRIGAACLLMVCCGATLKRQGVRAQRTAAKPAKRTAVEREAARLADSVCPPRE